MPSSASSPLRIGVLGAAAIARQFIAGIASSSIVKATTVASRDAAKAAQFAKETGIARSLGSYEALLADPEVDAIYNPLPNSMHAEWSIRAAEAGKHVLCEKPLAMSGAEARAMFAAAKRHGVHLVEAYPYRSQPQTQKLAELLREGAIGKVRMIRACFGITVTDTANIRLIRDLGGGSVLDAGSYPISLMRLAAGERPSRVHAVASWLPSDVDLTMCATVEFPSGAMAQISSSFGTAYHRNATIAGTEGTIETTFLNHPPIGGPPVVHIRRGRLATVPLETIEVAGGNGFLAEAESFARMVREGPQHWNGATEAESVDIMLTIEAMVQSARTGKPVDIPA